jgi:hypothetical protein
MRYVEIVGGCMRNVSITQASPPANFNQCWLLTVVLHRSVSMIGWPDLIASAANARLLDSKNTEGIAIRIFREFVHRKKSAYLERRVRHVLYTSYVNLRHLCVSRTTEEAAKMA